MNKPARTIAVLMVVALAGLVLGPSSATDADPNEPPAFSLAISPARLIVGQADVDTTQEVQVINGGTESMQVTVETQNFVTDRAGILQFQATAPYSASEWVTVSPSTFDVPAGETRAVSIEIDVPAEPEPGDHQLALVFLVPAGESSSNVRINRGIGSPVFITVPGATDDTAIITALDAGGFASGGPIDVTATVEDIGTVHRDFRGQTPLVLDAGGDAEPFPDFTVMRGGTRDIATTWDPPLLCICHPTLTIVNADGTESTMSVRVIVFPVWLALGVLAALVLLVLGYWLARRRYQANVVRAALALAPPVGVGVA